MSPRGWHRFRWRGRTRFITDDEIWLLFGLLIVILLLIFATTLRY